MTAAGLGGVVPAEVQVARLYAEHAAAVLERVRSLLRPADTRHAEDLAQEVWYARWMAAFCGYEPDNASGWLMVMAARVVAGFYLWCRGQHPGTLVAPGGVTAAGWWAECGPCEDTAGPYGSGDLALQAAGGHDDRYHGGQPTATTFPDALTLDLGGAA